MRNRHAFETHTQNHRMSPIFARRVTVLDPQTGRVLDCISRHVAARHFIAGIISVLVTKAEIGVTCVQRTSGHATMDAKPGSYGIHREHLEAGYIVFSHKPTWEKATA